jgi:uncharacterized protein (DUF2249 family)
MGFMNTIRNNGWKELILDLRELPCPQRHMTIFQEWRDLEEGKALLLINDHDPIPLFEEFEGRFPGLFDWVNLEAGPEIWRIRISKKGQSSPSGVELKEEKQSRMKPMILDARPIFQRGESPCHVIDEAVANVKPGERLILLVPFEPIPLYAKLARQGFEHQSRQSADGSWEVAFLQKGPHGISNGAGAASGDKADSNLVFLDTRGLEPPQPLVATLERLVDLPVGTRLKMHSDRKPFHLFPELESRGFGYDCSEQPDHSFVTEVWHESTDRPVRPQE